MRFIDILKQEYKYYKKQKLLANDALRRACLRAKRRGDYDPPGLYEEEGYSLTNKEWEETRYYGIIRWFLKSLKRWGERYE